ncbi:L-histidine N(alpha)-methyltransferase [Actinophytocola sp.]|uniref:L-histidine N(alpha)-methyltransferase n=1 Tax=Actinophytocola sp. TaxID=1872138 RepID=UPI00389AF1AE
MPAPPALEWVELAAGDRTARFIGLINDLSRPADSSGDGKRITSAHAFAGMGAANAWAAVCRDPLGSPARQSNQTFAARWRKIRASAPAEPCHYVSLGPGDGRKDGVVLTDLSRVNRDLCYLPVDTGQELLHLAITGQLRNLGLPPDRVMSLPWDFSSRESVTTLRGLLDELFGSMPMLFSLLGNTIAGFDDDTAVLALVGSLLRPGDRLLLEVEATTDLGPALAASAADEQAYTLSFGEFVTAALRHHTRLSPGWGDVEVLGAVEAERALVVKTVYRSGEDQVMSLPNGTAAPLGLDDTVRLSLSRKYSPEGLARLVRAAGLDVLADVCTGTGGPFGLALLVLARS